MVIGRYRRAIALGASPEPSITAANVGSGIARIALDVPRHPKAAVSQQKAIQNQNDALCSIHAEQF